MSRKATLTSLLPGNQTGDIAGRQPVWLEAATRRQRGRSDAHRLLEGALERRLGLVADRLCHGAGGEGRSPKSFAARVMRISVRRSLAERPSFSWKLPCECGTRHVAQPRQGPVAPLARAGSLKERGHGGRQAGMTGKGKESRVARRRSSLAPSSNISANIAVRQRVEHGAAAEADRCATGLRIRTTRRSSCAAVLPVLRRPGLAGTHDQARRQMSCAAGDRAAGATAKRPHSRSRRSPLTEDSG